MKYRCSACTRWLPAFAFAQSGVDCVCDLCAVKGKQAAESGAVSLPCLNGNNSISAAESGEMCQPAFYDFFMQQEQDSTLNQFSTSAMKSATALELNVHSFVEAKGVNYCGFLTLTFPDNVTCVREASRRFNSMNTNFLRHHVTGYIGVFERHKSGRIHFHLLTGHTQNIRSGIDFNAVGRRDYRSANQHLRSLWALLRNNLHKYGFGRAELLPVKSNSKGLARYIAKYIGKAIHARKPEDKGFRLVRTSQDKKHEWKVATSQFSFVSAGSRRWRESLKCWVQMKEDYLKTLAIQRGVLLQAVNEDNYNEVLSRFVGHKWAYKNRQNIVQFDDFLTLPMAA